jgi:hypothetical protein
VGWLDSLRGTFSFLFPQSRAESVVTSYVIREHHRGRPLAEILHDPYVTNRCTREQIDRLIVTPEVVHAIGEDVVSKTRTERAGATS